MRKTVSIQKVLLLLACLITPFITGQVSAKSSGKVLVNSKCAACHAPTGDGGWARISESRRTPEGWDMTVARMSFAHGVKLTSDERSTIVKYLADTYGLSLEETKTHRYVIERTPGFIEHPENQLIADTCARCHSYARVALQRRTESDWRKLVHFHVGQFPAIEIQAGGRDRKWFEIATGDVSKALGELYGLESPSWNKWKMQNLVNVSGNWRLVGRKPGIGAFEGNATIKLIGDDRYSIDMVMRYADGVVETAKGTAFIYSGYEWRATIHQGEKKINQVMALNEAGNELAGRWFEADNDAIGGSMRAVRADGGELSSILSVEPSMVRTGTRAKLTINGVGLSGKIELGPDVKILRVISRSLNQVVVEVDVAKGVRSGYAEVQVGAARAARTLAYYQQIDYLKIVPEHPLARVGGGGGPIPKEPVQLEAIAYTVGPDGKQDTEDDVQLGAVLAKWSVDNLNEVAEELKDKEYAGNILKNGLFVPGVAGPNPERKYQTNNAGELKVTATVQDGSRILTAEVPLIVTVQRFNRPPIL